MSRQVGLGEVLSDGSADPRARRAASGLELRTEFHDFLKIFHTLNVTDKSTEIPCDGKCPLLPEGWVELRCL